MDTKTMLAKMLQEYTGAAMCDSGGAYGRHWERNQGRKFYKEPAVTVEFTKRNGTLDINVTANLYHWLLERLEYDEPMDAEFQQFANMGDNTDKHWTQLMEEFAEGKGATGPYGDGGPLMFNSYDGECLLSQTIQFLYFEADQTAYVLLQIHNGADVRGGYTTPRVFTTQENIFAVADATIGCGNGHSWRTNDACNWYPDFSMGGPHLEDYTVVDGDDKEYARIMMLKAEADSIEKGQAFMDGFEQPKPIFGMVKLEDGEAFCPICGDKLEAWVC